MNKLRLLPGMSILLALICCAGSLSAEVRRWNLEDQPDPSAPAFEWQVVGEDAAALELELTVHWLDVLVEEGRVELRLPGAGCLGGPGDPALPALSRLLAAPGDAAARLEILEAASVARGDLSPTPRAAWASDRPGTSAPEVLPRVDLRDSGDPAAWASLDEGALWQGARVLGLLVQPVRWDSGPGHLEALRHLRLRVTWQRGQKPIPAPRRSGAAGQSLVRGSVLNTHSPWLSGEGRTVDSTLPGSYLVLTPDAALDGLEDWLRWKREMGHDVRVITESELGGVSTSYSQLQQAVQAAFAENPFDYLLLVGDVDRFPSGTEVDYNLEAGFIDGGSYSESQWGSRCSSSLCIVSDHLFSLLEGDDYFADVLVGRLSVDTANDLAKNVRRTVEYESAPFLGMGDEWFGRGLMIYDVAQAPSRRETKLSIRDLLMQELNFSEVDTIHNHYWQNPVNPAVVTQRINAGVSVVNYRGFGFRHQWYGPLFGVPQMVDLTNVGRWPFVTSIVCGGGDFASVDDDPCLGEGFLRAGAPLEPTGAIGFMGPSEEDTHTEWNNAIDEGIYHGLAREGLRTLGALMDRGKLELWNAYPNAREWGNPGHNVPFYFHTYNLLGDPGLELRTRAPRALLCEVPATLPTGLEWLDLHVAALDGGSLEGLRGCLYNAEHDLALTTAASADGRLFFQGTGLAAGGWVLTLSGPDLMPFRQAILVGEAESDLRVAQWNVMGVQPEDSLAHPGESLTLNLTLSEQGGAGAPAGRWLSLEVPTECAELLVDSLQLESSAPGQSLAVQGLSLRLASLLPFGEPLPLSLRLDGRLLAVLNLEVSQPGFTILETGSAEGPLVPGFDGLLHVRLAAAGLPAGEALIARLGSLHARVAVTQNESAPFELEPDSSRWLEDFGLDIDPLILSGSQVALELGIWPAAADPLQQAPLALLPFQLQVGTAGPTDPLGPDAGGYLAWHTGDSGPDTPVHEWSSISTSGEELEVIDWYDAWSENQDGVSRLVELPFVFRYYGHEYSQATICSNGWLAFGDHLGYWTSLNTPIPAVQGPDAMVAAYWTDLTNSSNGGTSFGHLYVEGRPESGLFLVEWNHFRPANSSANVDVQLILRDPALWPTPTGDGQILIHYRDVASNNGDNGVTIGLENPDETAGLQYVCNNTYAPAAQPVTDGSSLLFLPQEAQNPVAEPRTRPSARLDVSPNPFNPVTQLRVQLPEAARLRWSLHNLLGQQVVRQDWLPAPAGVFQAGLDGTRLASGVYLLTVEWRPVADATRPGEVLSEKVLLLR